MILVQAVNAAKVVEEVSAFDVGSDQDDLVVGVAHLDELQRVGMRNAAHHGCLITCMLHALLAGGNLDSVRSRGVVVAVREEYNGVRATAHGAA